MESESECQTEFYDVSERSSQFDEVDSDVTFLSETAPAQHRHPIEVSEEDVSVQKLSTTVLKSFAIGPPSDEGELEWTATSYELSPSSTSNCSMSLSPSTNSGDGGVASNGLTLDSSLASTESNAESEDSTLNRLYDCNSGVLSCPIPDESITIDQFGFIVREGGSQLDGNVDRRDQNKARNRMKKWRNMIGKDGSNWERYYQSHPSKLKRRIRKGVPDALRGIVWQLLSGGRSLQLRNKGIYEELVLSKKGEENIESEIIRDLNRTFPSHFYFQQRQAPGQRSLFNVLRAYSIYDSKVGYVQGMGFLAGMLLLYMCEEDAFWTFVALMQGTILDPIQGLYSEGFPLVQHHFRQFGHLIGIKIPKLGVHFHKEGIQPSMFCFNWFNTIFAYSLPFEHLLRVNNHILKYIYQI